MKKDTEILRTTDQLQLDRPFPNPKIPPKNISAGIKKDEKCSSPGCPNFSSRNCGFCELHCRKFHNGKHYKGANLI
jgi:hypothetical protein